MTARRIFLIGSPRSGTTWLAKLFDAHPDVFYRHEADSVHPPERIPPIVPKAQYPELRSLARQHIDLLFSTSTLKTNIVRPWFRKSYRRLPAELVRRVIVTSLRAAETMRPLASTASRIHVPEMIRRRDTGRVVHVVKSVIAAGRAGLYAESAPEVRFVLITRHPCAYVASKIRGAELGLMPARFPAKTLSQADPIVRRGLTYDDLMALGTVERAAWGWLAFNETMLEATNGLPNVFHARYEDVCEDPLGATEAMYAFAGLEMTPQTRAFVTGSQRAGGGSSTYFSLYRDAKESAMKWRHQLSPQQIATVERICADSLPGRRYFAEPAPSAGP